MVHSIAVSPRHVFVCQNSKLIQYELDGTLVKQIDSDLTKIILTAEGEYLIGHKNNTKQIVVINAAELDIVCFHEFPKRPSAFATTDTGNIVVSDKSGDVFRVDMLGDAKPELILGHVSMVLDLLSLPGHIASSDRDEHIRISRYPQPYVIEQFLLGHQSFVSHIAAHKEFLISGGDDPYLLSWNWQTGELMAKLDLAAGETVCGLATSEGFAYVLREKSNKVLKVSMPSLEVVENIEYEDIVHCIAVYGSKCLAGLASKIASFKEIEGPASEFVSEDYLRKR